MELIAKGPINKIQGTIKFWRLYKNYTQQSLADKCGVTVQTINNLETGKYQISKSMLLTISYVLGIDETQIISPYEIKEG